MISDQKLENFFFALVLCVCVFLSQTPHKDQFMDQVQSVIEGEKENEDALSDPDDPLGRNRWLVSSRLGVRVCV